MFEDSSNAAQEKVKDRCVLLSPLNNMTNAGYTGLGAHKCINIKCRQNRLVCVFAITFLQLVKLRVHLEQKAYLLVKPC